MAIELDNYLMNTSIMRKFESVDKKYRYLVKLLFLDERFCKKHQITPEVQADAVQFCDSMELFQTYEFLERIGLSENKEVAKEIRERHFVANGFGVHTETTLSQDSIYFNYLSVRKFFHVLGLGERRVSYTLLDSGSVFKIRRLESFKSLKQHYFSVDNSLELTSLLELIVAIRRSSKFKLLWLQSPESFLLVYLKSWRNHKFCLDL